ncbi:helix-turn-helix domain-containing protein [Streptomyces sp. NPDC048385]|uniref:helix-turn-helix domain-containing protein n=1 Tax=unclassified Streptomyces TaxID=2593676 RepID=UPI00342E3273
MEDVTVHDAAPLDLPLSRRKSAKARAAVLLALGGTSTIAGRALGVDPSTVRRWRQAPDFRGEVAQLRMRLVGHDPVGAFVALSGRSAGGEQGAGR